jgi:hypothetical protein
MNIVYAKSMIDQIKGAVAEAKEEGLKIDYIELDRKESLEFLEEVARLPLTHDRRPSNWSEWKPSGFGQIATVCRVAGVQVRLDEVAAQDHHFGQYYSSGSGQP